MPRLHRNQSGAGLIFVILILLIVSMVIAAFVSIMNTESFTAMNQSSAVQTFGIADGGVEYALKNKVFPNYSTAGSMVALGSGTFELLTPAYLTAAVVAGNTTITVNDISSFPSPSGKIVIDSEVMTYTSITGTTQFNLSAGTAAAQPHANNNSVYPVTALNGVLNIGGTTVTVNSTTGYIIPGVIAIDDEHIYCATVVSTTQFGTCARAYNGTTDASHTSGTNVFQFVFRSKGLITSIPVTNSAQRIVKADMTSRIRNPTMGWTWPPSKDWILGAFPIKPAAGSSIAFDSSTSATFSKTASPPFQWSHTVGVGGANRFLYVGLAIGQVLTNPLNSATSVTYAGQNLTFLAAQNHSAGAVRLEIWYLINPPTGANNVVVTMPTGFQFEFIGGSASFTGIDQTKPIDAPASLAQGTGTSASVNVTITTPNAYIVDALAQLKTPNTVPGASQIAEWQNIFVGGTLGAGSYTDTALLYPGAASNMKVSRSELY